ncbi:MAG: hypothetical protein Q9M75_09035 [Ghiorsea sp.]|nr:hypothetical protein [Ghiorsea sp.]
MINEIPLRARKRAKTKLALMNTVIEALKTQRLDEVSIKKVCNHVQVSEATFFNYFPKKHDVLVYFIQIWTIEVAWYAHAASKKSVLQGIQAVFDVTGKQCETNPNLMAEIIAYQARMHTQPSLVDVSLAERLLAFPDLEGVDTLPAEGLNSIFPKLIQQAIDASELPQSTHVEAAMLGLTAIFFGVPLVMLRTSPDAVQELYHQQLVIFWKGLDALGKCRDAYTI